MIKSGLKSLTMSNFYVLAVLWRNSVEWRRGAVLETSLSCFFIFFFKFAV